MARSFVTKPKWVKPCTPCASQKVIVVRLQALCATGWAAGAADKNGGEMAAVRGGAAARPGRSSVNSYSGTQRHGSPANQSAQRRNFLAGFETEARRVGADRVSDVARSQVRIVFFRHLRIAVAKLFGNDAHGNATHGEH
jgi:hypothetical protein